jgi:hypothetical protein
MIPKVRTALRAVGEDPAAEAIVADGSDPDALGRALSDPGFGTRFSMSAATSQPARTAAARAVGPATGTS